MCVKEWYWLDSNPSSKVTKPSLPKGRTRFLSDEERVKFLEACKRSKSPYLFIIVILAISTGMRSGELKNLIWKDIDFERERIVLEETKNGETRVLPLVGFALTLIKKLESSRRTDSQLLFPGKKKPENPYDYRSAWRVAVKRAQLEDFTFHDLRRTFGSYCVMNGSTLNVVGELLGHKSEGVTKIYTHLSDAYQKEAVSSMNEKVFGELNG